MGIPNAKKAEKLSDSLQNGDVGIQNALNMAIELAGNKGRYRFGAL